jgi:hypothetical protein
VQTLYNLPLVLSSILDNVLEVSILLLSTIFLMDYSIPLPQTHYLMNDLSPVYLPRQESSGHGIKSIQIKKT